MTPQHAGSQTVKLGKEEIMKERMKESVGKEEIWLRSFPGCLNWCE